MTPDVLAEEVRAFEHLDLQALRAEWRRRWGEPPKLRSRELLAYAATYRVQAEILGDAAVPVRRKMAELARRFAVDRTYRPSARPSLTVGCSLIREWGGARHVVRITEEGFSYQSLVFSSLSKVAQHITGAKRSGILFFGLKGKADAGS